MQINRKIVPSGLKNNPNRKMTAINYITIHNTGNYAATATAASHANYLNGGSGGSQTSWHYSCDDKEIWQSFEDTSMCWHAGDGNGPGNSESIGIEICVNFGLVPSNPAGMTQTGVKAQSKATAEEIQKAKYKFTQACENAARLTAEILIKHKLTIDRVVQHNKWSGKNCPMQMRSGGWGMTWNEFIQLVRGFVDAQKETVQPAAQLYRVRKSWSDAASQIGAYKVLDNAKAVANANKAQGYKVLDANGRVVYSP